MKNIFICLLTIFSLFTALQAEQHYQIFDISPKGSFSSEATDINEQGEIVGVYNLKNKSDAIIFLWNYEKGFQELVKLNVNSKSPYFVPPKINNIGHVIGSELTGGTWRELWMSYQKPFIWTQEKGKSLLNPSEAFYDNVAPVSINDHGQVLMVPINPCQCKPHRFWVWQEGTFDEIKKNINPTHLSNEQIIIGSKFGLWSDEIGSLMKLPLLYNYQDKSENPIAAPKGMKEGSVSMINDKQEYVVVFLDQDSKEKYYFYTSEDGLQELPAGFKPSSLNNHGEMIGLVKSLDKKDSFYLYQNGDLQKISFSSDDPNFLALAHITKINDGRQLVGTALYSVRGRLQSRAVFLVPTEDNRLIYRMKRLSNNLESLDQ